MSGPMSAVDRDALLRALPYARRYARALTGSQSRGDAVVAEALRGLLAGDAPAAQGMQGGVRTALYAAVSATAPHEVGTGGMSSTQRMLLLLTALEEQPL